MQKELSRLTCPAAWGRYVFFLRPASLRWDSLWLRLSCSVFICTITTNPKILCNPARIFPTFLWFFFGVRKLACALTYSEQTPREKSGSKLSKLPHSKQHSGP